MGDEEEKRSIINVFSDKPIDWPRSVRDVVVGTMLAAAFSSIVLDRNLDSYIDDEAQDKPDTELNIEQPAEESTDLAL